MASNILVVGGAGYIGSHMLLHLREAGYNALVFDNLSRGFSDAVFDTKLIQGDLRSKDDLSKCFEENEINLVMHFAALAYVGESVSFPELYYDNNVAGSINLLTEMKRYNVNKLVFSSTCATYGNPEYLPINELHSQKPINSYGRSKYMVEQIIEDYSNAYGINAVVLRYFNAAGCDLLCRVGERHNPETHLIPLILAEALRVKKGGVPSETALNVFGINFETADGSCVRDYIHVSDLCEAHLLSVKRLFDIKYNSPARFEFFNLANGKGFSVLEVIDVCRQVTGINFTYKTLPRRQGDPGILIGDSKLAENILGWKPKYADLRIIVETAWKWLLKSDLIQI